MGYFFFIGVALIALERMLRPPHDRLKKIEDELHTLTEDANNNASTLLEIEATLAEIAAHFSG
jgi:hypothetical protein